MLTKHLLLLILWKNPSNIPVSYKGISTIKNNLKQFEESFSWISPLFLIKKKKNQEKTQCFSFLSCKSSVAKDFFLYAFSSSSSSPKYQLHPSVLPVAPSHFILCYFLSAFPQKYFIFLLLHSPGMCSEFKGHLEISISK